MEKIEKTKKENGFIGLIINVVIPSIILTKYSSQEHLGQVRSLIIAISFPLVYGLWDFISKRKFNFISALGLISVLLTGGIGLFKLNKTWMIAKETAIPFIIGLAVLISQKSKKPIAKIIFEQIFDLEKLMGIFREKNEETTFVNKLSRAGIWLSGTFFLSAFLNFVLAVVILKGEPGSVEFNESLGKMTALSFPVISVPTLIMMGFIIYDLVKTIKSYTNLEIEDYLNQ